MIMASYTYTHLDRGKGEIRLVRLMPGSGDDDIFFSIFHAPLKIPRAVLDTRLPLDQLNKTLPEGWVADKTHDDRYIFLRLGLNVGPNSWDHPDPSFERSLYETPRRDIAADCGIAYEALSYTWGSPENLSEAWALGPQPVLMKIGANLALALKHLRHADQPRVLWVDALCINQDDIDEKNVEVSRMRHIYSCATQTIIWLGEEMDGSSHALKTLGYFAEQVEWFSGVMVGDAPGAEKPFWWRPNYHLPYDQVTWESIRKLFQRPWFSRVWVLQEALLSGSRGVVQCGAQSIPWPLLRKSIMSLTERENAPVDLKNWMASYRNALMGGPAGSNLAHLFQWVKYRHTTDQRDNVYGLLGLVLEAIADEILVDYRLPVSEVYKSAVITHVNVTKSLDMLTICRLSEKMDGIPSWVPSFSADRAGTITKSRQFGLGRLTARNFTDGFSACCVRAPNTGILDVMGVRCAVVNSVGPTASGSRDDILQTIYKWESEAIKETDYVGGGSMLDAFLQTILRGHTINRYPDMSGMPIESIRENYLRAKSGSPADKEELLANLNPSNLDGFTFLTTREGYFCLANTEFVEKGDIVCVMLGCCFPILLRATTSESFQVVSQLFVYGLMSAEAFLGPIPEPWIAEIPGREFRSVWFRDSLTMARTRQDPRLPPLPSNLEEIRPERSQEDPMLMKMFRNKETGEKLKYDSRVTPESLSARGVPLEWFRLV
ncbi:HET-domain-containing protein [Xylaria curta]|nr:HET-domain-containing protein [Xylaria curta]